MKEMSNRCVGNLNAQAKNVTFPDLNKPVDNWWEQTSITGIFFSQVFHNAANWNLYCQRDEHVAPQFVNRNWYICYRRNFKDFFYQRLFLIINVNFVGSSSVRSPCANWMWLILANEIKNGIQIRSASEVKFSFRAGSKSRAGVSFLKKKKIMHST